MNNFLDKLEEYGLSQELYENVCNDIDDKVNGLNSYDWSDICDKHGLLYNPDTLRKASTGIFGATSRVEYERLKNNNQNTNDDIDKKLYELKQERIKLQTANIERNRIDRAETRQQAFYEYVGAVAQSLPIPNFSPLQISTRSVPEEYVMTITDIHYGAVFTSENNRYSPEIVKGRLEELAGRTIEFIQRNNVSKLHIVNCGDSIQGILRMSDLQINDSTVVKSTVEISRLIASFITSISKYAEIKYYHVGQANHSQLRPLGSKANQLMNEDLEYLIGNYINDLCKDNSRINVILSNEGKGYIEFNVLGYDFIAMHGHQVKDIKNALKNLSMLKGNFYDYLLLGHFHGGQTFTNTETKYSNAETLIAPSFIGSDPYSDSLMVGAKSTVQIIGINTLYGHDETYNIILN